MTENELEIQSVSRDVFIMGMRQLINSVSVITTHGHTGRFGATVSAFSSVSADPPQLLACLRSSSRIANAVKAHGTFCLNVLSESQQKTAERFSGEHDQLFTDRFEGFRFYKEFEDWLVLMDTTAFACTISDQVIAGSHTIFIAQVKYVQTTFEDPLTYQKGRYRDTASSSSIYKQI
jgi:flavin reductase (DIM6/NTAB) family NADH-FMN oxidoreductase RutF